MKIKFESSNTMIEGFFYIKKKKKKKKKNSRGKTEKINSNQVAQFSKDTCKLLNYPKKNDLRQLVYINYINDYLYEHTPA